MSRPSCPISPARSTAIFPDDFTPTTIGGVGVDEIATMGNAGWTIAIGAQMRDAAEAMEKKTGAPYRLFERLCGLAAE